MGLNFVVSKGNQIHTLLQDDSGMEGGADSGLDMRDINISGPAVLAALTQACSQDASVLKPAEQQLHNWETQPGFYTVLHVDIDHQFNNVLRLRFSLD